MPKNYEITSGVAGAKVFSSTAPLTEWPQTTVTYTYTEFEGPVSTSEEKAFVVTGEGRVFDKGPLTSVQLTNFVQGLGPNCFSGGLFTTVTLPNSCTFIQEQAFDNCPQLASINLGSDLSFIGKDAFANCVKLLTINLPASLTNIDPEAFRRQCSFAAFNVNANNSVYRSTDSVLMSKDSTKLIRYPPAKQTTSYSIPNSVTEVKSYAFSRTNINELTIPSSVQSFSPVVWEDSEGVAVRKIYVQGCHLDFPTSVGGFTTVNPSNPLEFIFSCQSPPTGFTHNFYVSNVGWQPIKIKVPSPGLAWGQFYQYNSSILIERY